jgi:Mrp family chromosome partitioning ATPase/capsular polysaccharide biosynthesis protein
VTQDAASSYDLRWYLTVIWRRKFVILPVIVLIPLITYLSAKSPPPSYKASATVLLNRQSQGLSGLNDPTLWDPARTTRTQAQIARMPEVAKRVVAASGVSGLSPGGFLADSSVSSDPDNDLLTFRARAANPALARRFANLYARKYIAYRSELDTKALREASRLATRQLAQLRRHGLGPSTNVYQLLFQRQQQIAQAETLQASNSLLVRKAGSAGKVAFGSTRNLILAGGLAVILALGLAFVANTLDTRVRSVDDLVASLRLKLLGTIPKSRSYTRRRRRLVMLHDPGSEQAEPYRMLRASLDVARPADSNMVMVTSAVWAEGKTTVAANLALAMARAGKRVILVDLDFYRPALERLFSLPVTPGLTDVAAGTVQLQEAVRRVPLDSSTAHVPGPGPAFSEPNGSARGGSRGLGTTFSEPNGSARAGSLEVLAAGAPWDGSGDFIATQAFQVAMERVRHRADVVIADGPPLLLSGDALALSALLDSVLIVSKLGALKQRQVLELERVLRSCPALKLGIVVTSVPKHGTEYYARRSYARQRVPGGEMQRELIE